MSDTETTSEFIEIRPRLKTRVRRRLIESPVMPDTPHFKKARTLDRFMGLPPVVPDGLPAFGMSGFRFNPDLKIPGELQNLPKAPIPEIKMPPVLTGTKENPIYLSGDDTDGDSENEMILPGGDSDDTDEEIKIGDRYLPLPNPGVFPVVDQLIAENIRLRKIISNLKIALHDGETGAITGARNVSFQKCPSCSKPGCRLIEPKTSKKFGDKFCEDLFFGRG